MTSATQEGSRVRRTGTRPRTVLAALIGVVVVVSPRAAALREGVPGAAARQATTTRRLPSRTSTTKKGERRASSARALDWRAATLVEPCSYAEVVLYDGESDATGVVDAAVNAVRIGDVNGNGIDDAVLSWTCFGSDFENQRAEVSVVAAYDVLGGRAHLLAVVSEEHAGTLDVSVQAGVVAVVRTTVDGQRSELWRWSGTRFTRTQSEAEATIATRPGSQGDAGPSRLVLRPLGSPCAQTAGLAATAGFRTLLTASAPYERGGWSVAVWGSWSDGRAYLEVRSPAAAATTTRAAATTTRAAATTTRAAATTTRAAVTTTRPPVTATPLASPTTVPAPNATGPGGAPSRAAAPTSTGRVAVVATTTIAVVGLTRQIVVMGPSGAIVSVARWGHPPLSDRASMIAEYALRGGSPQCSAVPLALHQGSG